MDSAQNAGELRTVEAAGMEMTQSSSYSHILIFTVPANPPKDFRNRFPKETLSIEEK